MNIERAMTPRLLAIAGCVEQGAAVADIGTDHAYIPIYLVLNGIAKRAVAMDLRTGPLERAKQNICSYRVENTVKTRLSDGLSELKEGEVDTVIIAGMGGILINEILDARRDLWKSVDTFILQPMTAVEETRRYLEQNGFIIQHELLAKEDHKLYSILTIKKGYMKIEKEVYYVIGKRLMEEHSPYVQELICSKMCEFEKVLNGLANSENPSLDQKRREIKRLLEQLDELKGACAAW